jgi:hypothetical protein
MSKHRSAALALAACAASLTVAACSAGTPTASSSTAGSAGSSQSGSASAAASSPGAAMAGRAISVKGKLGSFPVPAGARVVENITGRQAFILVFGLVAPADVSRFYAAALPQAGFTVATNAMLHQGGDFGAYIVFTGHGYKGNINSLTEFPGTAVAGIGDKNVTTVVVTPTT